MQQEPRERNQKLVETFNWSRDDAASIWCFGPEDGGTNVLLDITRGIQHMKDIRDSMVNSFQSFTRHGALVEEESRGLRINIADCVLHADSTHRGDGQLIPAARRLYSACELASSPSLYEPVYYCEISAPTQAIGGVYQVVNQRRGQIIQEDQVSFDQNVVKFYLPIAESFGLTESLREKCQGRAFPQCSFHHWELIKDLPHEAGSKAE